jgi:predicted DNA-binding protein
MRDRNGRFVNHCEVRSTDIRLRGLFQAHATHCCGFSTGIYLAPKCVHNGHTMPKDTSLRIRLDTELHQRFLEVCRAQDKPAAQVLREYMRSYVQRNRDLLDAEAVDDTASPKTKTR